MTRARVEGDRRRPGDRVELRLRRRDRLLDAVPVPEPGHVRPPRPAGRRRRPSLGADPAHAAARRRRARHRARPPDHRHARRPTGRSTVPLQFAPITDRQLRVTVSAVRPEDTIEYFSRSPLELPVSIAEVGIPGVRVACCPRRCRPRAAPTCSPSTVSRSGCVSWATRRRPSSAAPSTCSCAARARRRRDGGRARRGSTC